MSNPTISDLKKQVQSKEMSRRHAWKRYYTLFENMSDIVTTQNLINDNIPKHESEKEELSFLKQQYLGLLRELKKFVDCPVCLETITDTNELVVHDCGHILCKPCRNSIAKLPKDKHICPECRKSINCPIPEPIKPKLILKLNIKQ